MFEHFGNVVRGQVGFKVLFYGLGLTGRLQERIVERGEIVVVAGVCFDPGISIGEGTVSLSAALFKQD
jgi:hypothetical protein